jgi:hypothetical protein
MSDPKRDPKRDVMAALLAKQEISEAIYRYCRAYDRMDLEMALRVWHPGGTVAYAELYNGPAADYFGPSWNYRAALANFSHQVTNILIELDGDKAASEAYVTASLQQHPVDGTIKEDLYRGRYLDRWSHRDGRWAIDHRHFIPDSFTRIAFDAGLAPAGFIGLAKKDRSDPSYALLND